ncbi:MULTISPECIES: hypothetical protein [unclassified Streptomyces]|uniref:hypothetical protein n=1 Tax=unclassified Streptomyces TaxID=2593676 RepID=UPI0022572BEC|nr:MULTISPECIES: hypothetical protein [unclassified Streptomyces]MCX4799742.1 hypothetical protein [Streptomyces sp. NBC_01242]WSJ41486.1 hypothetical protein OG772_36905 [Streptomyces sp. NBC_01321]WSP67842.1 hypothetical protein OG466_39495 [Streptomyces sp. NBC_01240]WSU26843.1 hypothetical protein OG508_39130 [Streptomyces sp. NBC_01108]
MRSSATPEVNAGHWQVSWGVQGELEATIGPVPYTLFLAKARRLCDQKNLLGGCPCGCRGDYHLPDECLDRELCSRA